MTRKKRTSKRGKLPKRKEQTQQSSFKSDAGELWIHPDLNRKITGPGGNRGEHTTSAATLLELAEIALKKGA